jgi:uncharacterized protein DUF4157
MKERTRVHHKKGEASESPPASIETRSPIAAGTPGGTLESNPATPETLTSPSPGPAPAFGHSLGQMEIVPREGAGGAGQSLPPDLEARFAGSLGDGLRSVQIHTDSSAAALASSMNARAVTLGHRIHLPPGEYRPDSPAGQDLLAHEAVHVAQQASATTQAPGRIPDSLEQEATVLGPLVARGGSGAW